MRRYLKRWLITLLLGAISAAVVMTFNVWLHAAYASRVYASIDDVPIEDAPRDASHRIAIVFGAGLTRTGEPTPALYDRVATAVDLYKRGLVKKLLLTGDNRFINYNTCGAVLP